MKSKGIFYFLFGMCISVNAADMPPTAAMPCPFTINPGPDITICNPGQTVSLGTTVTGPYLSAMWSPSTGLSNPNSPTTNATVNQTTTYTLTVSGVGSTNLITNGDFSAGLTGFSSNYTPGTGGPWGVLSFEGTFAVASNPTATHTAFASCSDHTGGGGNMLVVNGAGTPNQNVWCQTVNVTPNTNYSFSAWGASVVASSPAILQISINGGLLGSPFTLPATTCQWTQFFQLWNSGAASTATICIVNQNTQPSGNDFALDDLVFSPVCEETVQVTVNVQNVSAAWTPPQGLCPLSPAFNLNNLLSPSATPGGVWTINGTPDFLFDPTFLGQGTHSVSYTVGEAPCIQTLTLPIVVNPLPNVLWTPPPPLCTNTPAFPLNILLVPGALTGGQWTVNGVTATSFQPSSLGPGLHTVIYTAGTQPCVNSLAQLIQVLPLPNASWTPPALICSGDTPFPLNSLLDPGAEPGGTWTINGLPATVFNPAALPPGPHLVVYRVGPPECQNSVSGNITITPRPTSTFTVPPVVCASDTSLVTFTGTAGPSAVFQWNFADAAIASGSGRGPYRLVWPSPGTRNITLVVNQNGCVSDTTMRSVRVDTALTAPVLICRRTETTVEFVWQHITGTQGYTVTATSGQSFSMSSDTSVLFENLSPGEVVEVLVHAISNGACGDTQATASCTASACPSAMVAIQPVDPLCWDGMTDTLQLEALISGDASGGQLTWSGDGIINAQTGLWQSRADMAGQSVALVATYTYESCAYTDTVLVQVFPLPASNLGYDAQFCQSDSGEVFFMGTPIPGANYIWDFGEGTAFPGTGPGPHILSFDAPGAYPVTLVVQANGCTGPATTVEIVVHPVLLPPVIQCESTSYSTVVFSWTPVANAASINTLVTSGQTGMALSDTSFQVSGLMPGEEAHFLLAVLSANTCPAITASASCTAIPCPDVTLMLDQPEPICWDGSLDTLQLNVQISNGPASGNLRWEGEGIADTTNGTWISDAGMIGRNIWVKAVFADDICVFTDSIAIPVFFTPDIDLHFDSLICETETAIITYQGNALPSATFMWNFVGAVASPGAGPGPHTLSFFDPGEYTVILRVENNGCISPADTARIQVDTLPDVPVVLCETTYTSITFTWAQGAHVDYYTLQTLGGLPGAMLSDTSFRVEGLNPGQPVQVELTGFSANSCPDVSASATCFTQPCPNVTLAIEPVSPVCWDGNPDTLQLSVQIGGDQSSGSLRWEGEGIANAVNGFWTSAAGMIGQTVWVKAVYTEDVCVFADSMEIAVFATPDNDLISDSLICISEDALIQYAGSASPTANYNWQFDNGTALPGAGPGPHTVRYDTPGTYTMILSVEENGCTSLPDTATVQVDAQLPVPVIQCAATLTSVVFSWQSIPGAGDYQLSLPVGLTPQWTSDTSVLLSNLSPATSVSLSVEALSNTACPNTIGSIQCQTLVCPSMTLSMQGPAVVCAGDSARLQFGISGSLDTVLDVILSDGINTWSLSGVRHGATFSILPALYATVSVVSAVNPLLSFCPVNLPPPVAIAVERPRNAGVSGAPLDICAFTDTLMNLNSLLSGADTGGVWSLAQGSSAPATGAFQPGTGSFNPRQTNAGTYRFQYILAAGAACPADTAIAAIQLLTLPPADAGPDRTLDCLNPVVSIGRGGISGLEYRWTTGNGNLLDNNIPMVEVDMPGTYRLEVRNPATGCRAFDEVNVLLDIAVLQPSVRIGQISCYGANDGLILVESVSGGTPPITFSMNGSTFTSQGSYANLGPGIYNLLIRDAAGCETALRFDIIQPLEVEVVLNPIGLSSDNTLIRLGDSLRLQVLTNLPPEEIASVQWSPDLCAGCVELALLPTQSAAYAVTVTNVNGCSATARLPVNVDRRPAIFVPNAFSPNNDGLNDVLIVFAGRQVRYIRSLLIFDRWGEPVFEVYDFPPNNPAYGWDGTHRGKEVTPAVFVYFLEAETIDGEKHLLKGDVTVIR